MTTLRIVSALSLLLVTILSPGCSRQDDSPFVRLALETEPTTLDPAYAVDFSSGLISSLVHSNLVRFDVEGRIVPDLAGSWEISEDGKVYTFNLVPARFSNGRLVRARDVLYSFRRLIDPDSVSPRWWVLEPLLGAASFHEGGRWNDGAIGVPDDSTVVLRLERAVGHFLSLLSMPAAGIVCIEGPAAPGAEYGRSPCGSGPWRIAGWKEGDELLLTRNPFYGGSEPKVEGVIFRIIPESMTRIAEFEVGYLDVLEVPRAELDRWRSAGPSLLFKEELRVVYIGLNNNKPPFNDPRVRRALNMAIDVETIIAKVLFGAGRKARGVIPPGLRKSREPDDIYHYDPEEAGRLLAEAGYPGGFAMEIWQRENPEGGRVLESVQGYLARVGVEVKLVTREWGAFKQAVDRGTADAFYLDWFADYPDAENFLAPLFHSLNRGGGGNRSGYSNSRVDTLIERASLCRSDDERWELLESAERMVYEEAPWIFLWFPTRYEVVSPRLKGYMVPAIFNGQRFLTVSL